ncbi:MAG: hypothetical protein ACM3NQ_02545 [Bacteroidales bacterium]
MTARSCLLCILDVGVGLLLAGAVAPLVLVVLPAPLRGRAFLFAMSAACIVAAAVLRRCATRGK